LLKTSKETFSAPLSHLNTGTFRPRKEVVLVIEDTVTVRFCFSWRVL